MKLKSLTLKEINTLEAEAKQAAATQIEAHFALLRDSDRGAFCIGYSEHPNSTCPVCQQNAAPPSGIKVFYGSHGPVCADCASRFCPELFELIDESHKLTFDCDFDPFGDTDL